MSITSFHDMKADLVGHQILSKIRNKDKQFRQIFSSSTARIGWSGWPQPDFVLADINLGNSSLALEFKPPKKSKREYLTGLGQAIGYLNEHNYSGLIVPEKSGDGFPIADFIKKLLNNPEMSEIPISLYSYDENSLNHTDVKIDILKKIKTARKHMPPSYGKKGKEVFWSWWRENSPSEIFHMLEISEKYSEEKNDIYTNHVWPEFWKKLINGQTYNWEKNPRKINSQEKSHKQNFKIPLNQLNLHNPEDGKITPLGRKYLAIGKQFSPFSDELKTFLAQLVLINGKHLELICLLEKFQNMISDGFPMKREDFMTKFDDFLIKQGHILPEISRKPSLRTTGNKKSYIRDEIKLWNKLGFLVNHSKGKYFNKKRGLTFSISEISRVVRYNSNVFFE